MIHEFAMTVPTPDREAVIVYDMGSSTHDFSIPISTEAEAYRLCKKCGIFGFWRLKDRAPRSTNLQRESRHP